MKVIHYKIRQGSRVYSLFQHLVIPYLFLRCPTSIIMIFLYNFLAFFFSAAMATLMIREILRIAYKRKLFDFIDGRKVHKVQVPRLGGVAFTPSIIMSISLLSVIASMFGVSPFFVVDGRTVAYCLFATLLIYSEGMADDLLGLSYQVKFLFQFICATMLVLSGVHFTSLYGLLGVYDLPTVISYPLSVIFIVGITNAINLIDGIDGLASGLSMIALAFFGIFGMRYHYAAFSITAFATLGVVVPFFYYNVFGRAEKEHKIFMGDCGSQTIGLILGMLSVRFCMLGHAEEVLHLPNTLIATFGLLIVPCFDVIRVMVGRMRRGKSPFHPDKTHIHHKFLALGFTHRRTMVTILLIAMAYAILTLAMSLVFNINIVVLLDAVIWTTMHLYLNQLMRKKGCLNYFEER